MSERPQQHHDHAPGANVEQIRVDVALVEKVLAGSIDAWHEFIHRFERLIYSVLHRQLFGVDKDEIDTLFVDILKELYDGKLGEYEGRASLSTWLVLSVRMRSYDLLRKRNGRRRLPEGFARLSKFDQRVFRFHYIEAMDLGQTIQALEWEGQSASADTLADAVTRIETQIDNRYLKRLGYERYARAVGARSGRFLEFLLHAKSHYEAAGRVPTPDDVLSLKDTADRIKRVRQAARQLSQTDQQILHLRFDEGQTAKQISDELDLGGPRRVYSRLERIMLKLRYLITNKQVKK